MDQEEKVLKRKIDSEGPAAMASIKKSHNQGNDQGTRNWSNLPNDILRKIMRNWSFSERLCMTATCKGWRIPIHEMNTLNLDGLPWLLWCPYSVGTGTLLYQIKLYEPGNPNPYSIRSDIVNKGGRKLHGARVFASKFGWVVLRTGISKSYSLFLYSPFMENILQLPSLPVRYLDNWLFTFSHVPTSPDCTFFLIKQRQVKQIKLYTFRNGEREWKSYVCDQALRGCCRSWIDSYQYLDGTLYCLFKCRLKHILATFNVNEQEWSVKTTLDISKIFGDHVRVIMLESGKWLLASSIDLLLHDTRCDLFKYDFSEDELTDITSLEDEIYFFDRQTTFSVEVHGEAKGEFANRVYCNDGFELGYFSVEDEDGKMHIDRVTYNFPFSLFTVRTMESSIFFLDVSRLEK